MRLATSEASSDVDVLNKETMHMKSDLPYDPGGTENDGDDEDDFSIFFGICNISKPSKASSEQPTITRKIKPSNIGKQQVDVSIAAVKEQSLKFNNLKQSPELKAAEDNCLLLGICNEDTNARRSSTVCSNSSSKKLMSTKKSLSREAKSGSRNGCRLKKLSRIQSSRKGSKKTPKSRRKLSGLENLLRSTASRIAASGNKSERRKEEWNVKHPRNLKENVPELDTMDLEVEVYSLAKNHSESEQNKDIKRETDNDPEGMALKEVLTSGWPSHKNLKDIVNR